jgi:cytosine/adenosine deaminase-related metal-dependent hydrolase
MITFTGTEKLNNLVLQGRVVTMSPGLDVIEDGSVCIDANRIVAVVPAGALLPEAFRNSRVVQTRGTMYPGLIELHNHLAYNYIPTWNVPRRYTNRNTWIKHEPEYLPNVQWPSKLIAQNTLDLDYPRSVARYVECRSLFGGVTTTQGLSSGGGHHNYVGLLRNVEAPNDPAFKMASGQTADYASKAEVASKLVPELAKNLPFFYHLSEGTDADARQRFFDLEHEPGKWAVNRNLIAIHGVALEPLDLRRMSDAAGIVWSPLSNYLLYGATADISSALEKGVTLALGSDWSPSGSKNLFGELKIADIVNSELGGLLKASDLARMVTSTPARILGWEREVGSIEVGKRADILILEGDQSDPYDKLVNTREDQIIAILIDGRPRLVRQGLANLDLKSQELVRVGRQVFVLDLVESGSDPLAGLSLSTATTKLADGLAHLPDLARKSFFLAKSVAPDAFASDFAIDLEFDFAQETTGMAKFFAGGIDPDRVIPLALEPLTEVDDTTFRERLSKNVNLPKFLRDALS